MKSTKKLLAYWIGSKAATFRSRNLVLSFRCLDSGIIQACFAITLSHKPSGCHIAETSDKILQNLQKNLPLPSSRCAITQFTTIKKFRCIEIVIYESYAWLLQKQLRNECLYWLIHFKRALSYSHNRFFVYEYETLSVSSYSLISHVFLSFTSSSVPQVFCARFG